MLKKRIAKIAFVLACVMTMIMPYTSTVLAAALTKDDTKADLQVLIMHQGGEESSGTLTEQQKEYYDEAPYGYTIGDTRVYKIIAKDDVEYTNIFYCLNANKSFPGVTNEGYTSLEYTNVADFKDATDSNVKALHLSTEYNENSTTWTSNYKALVWLVNNMYLSKQTPEQKDNYLAKAFAEYTRQDLDTVKAFLTDDDIDVVQQFAIWYFTNNDTEKFNTTTLPSVRLSQIDIENATVTDPKSYKDVTGSTYRQEMADHLFRYLIESAIAGKETEVTYPSFATTTAKVENEEDYYVAGPFKVNGGTAASTEFSLTMVDQDDKLVSASDYKIKIDGETEFTSKSLNEIFDKEYYVYIPKTNTTITSVKLVLNYSSYDTYATLWENKITDENGIEVYQPLVLINREKTPHITNVKVDIDRTTADLALRKYIIKVNDKTYSRQPEVDITNLKNGTSKTAEYKHAKDPVTVQTGDTVVYEIRVYNEADIDATGTLIVDSLPAGLELVEDSEINRTYNWTLVNDGTNNNIYSSDYLKDKTINAFNKDTSTELDSAYVQIECKIASDAKTSAVLTNIAEISEDGIDDRDSTPSNNDYTNNDYDQSKYTGNNSNKTDLTDKNYYYQGREDDDDFEKIYVEGKVFDLALQKFITKVNGATLTASREPEVDVTNLKNGSSTDATYKTAKTPVSVKKGDIVVYTIRVYNEGEAAGYAEQVADYLPEGLGFLVNYTLNVDNFWAISKDSKTVKLNTIDNATSNVKLEDFTDLEKLEDAEVVVGKTKITSTKLKSSNTDNKNLINAFDKTTGTTLAYKDIQVACVVLADEVSNGNLKNIAEVTKHSDENKDTTVVDVDSTPDNVDPTNPNAKEDDDDFEDLTIEEPKEFDLALKKYITKVNDTVIKDREPKVTVTSDGKIAYTTVDTPLKVENNDLITYTIRVYNEGDISGYAKLVGDDIPAGLQFVTDNQTNKNFGWKLYDKNGNVTTDLSQAVSVKTDYLSKANATNINKNLLINAFDGTKVSYQDVQIVFKIAESSVKDANRQIINTAEIQDDEDKDGNPVYDKDSTPGNNKDDEDDIDKEIVYVKYFDLSLTKDLVKVIVTEDGKTREISLTSADGLQKVEIHRKKLNSTTVKFVYKITVKNEGEIAGYATEITDYIPTGLEFIADENKQWTKVSNSVITTNALSSTKLEPGQTASVQVVLKWINGENNIGLKTNAAEISADKNDSNTPDIDSTPNNKVPKEDDYDIAEIFLGISTGTAPTYFALTMTVLAIMTTGVILIKKYVLDI